MQFIITATETVTRTVKVYVPDNHPMPREAATARFWEGHYRNEEHVDRADEHIVSVMEVNPVHA